MTKLVGIPSEMLSAAWPKVAPLIERASAGSGGRFTTGDFAKAIAEREMQLWGAMDGDEVRAIALTRLLHFPRLMAGEALAVIGEGAPQMVEHFRVIEAWAASQGAKQFRALVRPGWSKVLKPEGYEMTHWLMEKPL